MRKFIVSILKPFNEFIYVDAIFHCKENALSYVDSYINNTQINLQGITPFIHSYDFNDIYKLSYGMFVLKYHENAHYYSIYNVSRTPAILYGYTYEIKHLYDISISISIIEEVITDTEKIEIVNEYNDLIVEFDNLNLISDNELLDRSIKNFVKPTDYNLSVSDESFDKIKNYIITEPISEHILKILKS